MKMYNKIFVPVLFLMLSVVFGCKKDNNNDTGSNKKYTVKFVGNVTAGSTITTAIILYGTNTKSFTGLTGTSWTKELELTESDLRAVANSAAKNISFGIQGQGKDANATGNVEIFINNVSVKTAQGTGTVLSPNATYNF